ncbi:MAG: AI-2E family transporter [Acidobacteriota bacterium]
MQQHTYTRIFLLICSLIVLYFVFRIFQPFLFPIFLAAILVTLTYPAFDWTCRRLKGGRNLASVITCLWITILIIVPFLLMLILVTQQITGVYGQFQESLDEGELQAVFDFQNNPYLGPWTEWLGRQFDLDFSQIDVMGSVALGLRQVSIFFLQHTTAILSGFFQFIASFFIMIFTMFFLFRDGSRLREELQTWTPLSARHEGLIVSKFQEVASATVLGSLATAIAQGVAQGIILWMLGASNVLLWSTLAALFSLVPIIGTSIVWVPWSVYFLATGEVMRAIILVLLSVLLVGSIDNVLRPVLIEGRTKMHTLVVFFSIMGGIAYFGVVGMILGPIVVALGLTFVELYKTEFEEELKKDEPLQELDV